MGNILWSPQTGNTFTFCISADIQNNSWTLRIVHPFGIIETEMWKELHFTNPFTMVWIASHSQLPDGLLYLITWMLKFPQARRQFYHQLWNFLSLSPFSWGVLALVQNVPSSQPTGVPARLFPFHLPMQCLEGTKGEIKNMSCFVPTPWRLNFS